MSYLIGIIKIKIIIPIIIVIAGIFGIQPPINEGINTTQKISAPKVISTSTEVKIIKNDQTALNKDKLPQKPIKTNADTGVKLITDPAILLKQGILEKITRGVALDTEEVNAKSRKSIINIFCTTKTGGDFKPISGSGIVISESGIILTNAHVAQYLLLKDYRVKDFISCIGRIGSPAIPEYELKPIYLPESWLKENAPKIKEESPTGTGENDYAFLGITGVQGQGLSCQPHSPTSIRNLKTYLWPARLFFCPPIRRGF